MKFKEFQLEEVCDRIRSGKNIKAQFVYEEGRYPVYGGNGLRGYTDTANFEGECAIVGRQGAFCGNVRFFKGKAYMTEHAVVICANENHNTRYLAYLLSQMNLGRLSAQSAQPGISVKTLSKQIVQLPDKSTQDKIACILSNIEDKISLNQKINDNLEQQALALFEKFSESENHKLGSASDIAYLNPKRILKKGDKARCIDMAKLPTRSSFPSGWEYREYSGGARFQNGDTLLARITPCLENGKTAFIDFLDDDEVAYGSTEYIVLAPKSGVPAEYLYCLARYPSFVDYAVKNMNGSSGRQRVSAETIGNFELFIPDQEEFDRFGELVHPMFVQIRYHCFQNMRLAELRDALLPKLMSGEIDVEGIEL